MNLRCVFPGGVVDDLSENSVENCGQCTQNLLMFCTGWILYPFQKFPVIQRLCLKNMYGLLPYQSACSLSSKHFGIERGCFDSKSHCLMERFGFHTLMAKEPIFLNFTQFIFLSVVYFKIQIIFEIREEIEYYFRINGKSAVNIFHKCI